MIKRFKNISGITKIWCGKEFLNNSEYDIPASLDDHWQENSVARNALLNNEANMSDGLNTFTGLAALSLFDSARSEGDSLFITSAKTPVSSTAPGRAGQICWDATYFYVCTADNSWKRILLLTF